MYSLPEFRSIFGLLLLSGLFSCIGTDIVEDSISRIQASASQGFVNVGESVQMTSFAVNEFGDEFDVAVAWHSSDSEVATVDAQGIVTGVSQGQATITASFEEKTSNVVRLNVIDETSTIAYINVSGPGMRLEVGESLTLTAAAYDASSSRIEDVTFEWISSDEEVAMVANGTVTAIADGTVEISALADGVSSDPFTIIVGGEEGVRTGSFTGKGGYDVTGDVRVSVLDVNSLQVSLQDNFNSDNGPGLWVYLSNFDNSVEEGVELMPLESTSGPSSYIAEGVGINDYQYVIILCKPFNIVFGLAELN